MKFASVGLALALVGAVSVSSTAQAKSIRYDDLDLSTREGAAALRRRIQVEARRYCDAERTMTSSRNNSASDCERGFRRDVEEQLPAAAREALSRSQSSSSDAARSR